MTYLRGGQADPEELFGKACWIRLMDGSPEQQAQDESAPCASFANE